MKRRVNANDALGATILAALAELDQKGNDEKITQAMAIVFEAFQLHAAKRTFSVEDLLAPAIRH